VEYVVFFAFTVYLSPWIFAVSREHPQHAYILLLDLSLGWTGLGWALAWLWALTQPDPALTRGSRNARLRLIPGGLAD
jgi:hypothetical protein